MTQTSIIHGNSFQEIRVSIKRRESNGTDEKSKKFKPDSTIVRSKINADDELWNKVSKLKEDSRIVGIIPRLETQFEKGNTRLAYLCSPLTDHLGTGLMDVGWGCGYRNCQMLMSFLEKEKEYDEPLLKHAVDIQSIQFLIERAWNEGFDSIGAAQLENRVFKTRKWIGTTEVHTLLTYLGICSTIIDFHHPDLHKDLLDWIQRYFSESIKNEKEKTVYITNRPPLYLQHQGHSRTVIGIEILKTGKRNLIMFDPGKRVLRSYKKPIKSSNSFVSKIKDNPLLSGYLKPFRVDDKSIGKHKQYQILVLGRVNNQNGKISWDSKSGFLLNEDERESMKNITSITIA